MDGRGIRTGVVDWPLPNGSLCARTPIRNSKTLTGRVFHTFSGSGHYLQRSASKHPHNAQVICTAQPPRWVLRWRRSRAQRPQRAPQSAHERAPLGSAASRCSPETPLRYPVSKPLPIDAAHLPRCPQPPTHTVVVSNLHAQSIPQLSFSRISSP